MNINPPCIDCASADICKYRMEVIDYVKNIKIEDDYCPAYISIRAYCPHKQSYYFPLPDVKPIKQRMTNMGPLIPQKKGG